MDSVLKKEINSAINAEPEPMTPEQANDEITRLAAMSEIEYAMMRKETAKRLGMRVTDLDMFVYRIRKETEPDKPGGVTFNEPEPWLEPVDGGALLNEITGVIKKFIVCANETVIAVALWILMTWFIETIHVAPILNITAPEKQCGKSQLLAVVSRLAKRPLISSNVSPAALYRTIEMYTPTLLIDEADTFVKLNDELRGIINAGHARDSAYVLRCVGDAHEPTKFSTFGPKAMAGIGDLPETIMDRSIVAKLRRKKPSEKVQKLRHSKPELFDELVSKIARFAEDNRDTTLKSNQIPEELDDRAGDNWESLLAIASIAGGDWPKKAQDAAKKISGNNTGGVESIGQVLLLDIKEKLAGINEITLSALHEKLIGDKDLRWAAHNRGKPITTNWLSKRLRNYGIELSKPKRDGNDVGRKYNAGQFSEVFEIYIPDTLGNSGYTVTNSDNTNCDNELACNEADFCNGNSRASGYNAAESVTENVGVTVTKNHPVTTDIQSFQQYTGICNRVTENSEVSTGIYSADYVEGVI